MTLGNYGVDIYGTGLITRKDYWDQDDGKEITKAFVAAVAIMRKYHPEVDLKTGIEAEMHGLGYIGPAKMQATYNAVVTLLGQPIPQPVTAY
ncbi:MAG: hypothetical protein ACREFO_19335 [Acetobacteraceae bacterium]